MGRKPFLKLPNTFKELRISLNKDKYTSVNLYFQDESRFGLMSHMGSCISARGVRPVIHYAHKFSSTYLYGSYSPIDGDSFVWEVNGVSTQIFEAYLNALSAHRPKEFKIVVIDNAGFHSTKNIEVPDNIYLLNIPPYTPELNPCEQIWAYLKTRFKNQVFKTMDDLKEWLYYKVENMSKQTIMSITANHHYLNEFYTTFKN
jgi:transposase